jgi:hypothetical protein
MLCRFDMAYLAGAHPSNLPPNCIKLNTHAFCEHSNELDLFQTISRAAECDHLLQRSEAYLPDLRFVTSTLCRSAATQTRTCIKFISLTSSVRARITCGLLRLLTSLTQWAACIASAMHVDVSLVSATASLYNLRGQYSQA